MSSTLVISRSVKVQMLTQLRARECVIRAVLYSGAFPLSYSTGSVYLGSADLSHYKLLSYIPGSISDTHIPSTGLAGHPCNFQMLLNWIPPTVESSYQSDNFNVKAQVLIIKEMNWYLTPWSGQPARSTAHHWSVLTHCWTTSLEQPTGTSPLRFQHVLYSEPD